MTRSRSRKKARSYQKRSALRRSLQPERLEDRRMMAGAAFESTDPAESVDVVRVAEVRLEVTDRTGAPLSTARKGDELQLAAYVRDKRFVGHGVFAAYLDVLFDSNKLAVDGPVLHGEAYPNNTSGDTSQLGLIDEVGGFAGLDPVGSEETLLFQVPLRALDLGLAQIWTDAADEFGHEFLIYGDNQPVSIKAVDFGGTTLEIVAGVDAIDDVITVMEDGVGVRLNLLSNDLAYGQSVSITSYDLPDQGGRLQEMDNEQDLLYTPRGDFYGHETFSYTVTDASGQDDTARVRVMVQNVNDPPAPMDDAFTVTEDSSENRVDILANDSYLPDPEERLKIVDIGLPSHGGNVELDAEGHLLYTPASDFHGVETVTYTVSDGIAVANAVVAFTVENVDDPPIATGDHATIFNYSDGLDEPIDVLANDATHDPGEQLTIIEASTPGDGQVEIDAGGSRLLYTPEPFTYGEQKISYTISDGSGGTAVSTVLVVLENPWHNYPDPLDINRDGGVTPLDALIDVNYLNHLGAGVPHRPESVEEYGVGPFMDPSFDGRITALDPLMVINYLNSRSVAPTPPDGVAGPLQFRVTDRLVPEAVLPEFTEGEERPVSRMTDFSGIPVDFASNELFVITDSNEELEAFAARWEGEVLGAIQASDFEIEGLDLPGIHLVRINTELAAVSQLPHDLWALDPANHGEHRISDAQGLQLLAAAAHEQANEGTQVGINWIGRSAAYRDGNTAEAMSGRALTDGSSYSRNTFDWPHLNAGSVQDIGVTEAWRALELAGRLDNKVPFAVLDGGFQPNGDFPDDWVAVSNVPFSNPIGTRNPGSCGSGNPCPWHGTKVVMAGMGVPDNGFGGAGPAGPVARPILVHTFYDFFTSMFAVLEAKALGAKIINMSYGARVPAALSFSVLPFDFVTSTVRSLGTLLFASAGNNNENVDAREKIPYTGIKLWEKAWHTPAENSGVIAVGGLADNSKWRHSSSNYGGNEVDLFAPWTNWVGPDPDNPADFAQRVGGTSFASPYAAGVAALIWAAQPGLSAGQVKDILYETAHESPDSRVDHYVNAAEAVFRALGDVHPYVRIITPTEGQSFSAGGISVALSAEATDLEDGRLSGSSVVWSSDRDGQIGTGAYLETRGLSQGDHVISVTARDSAGHETTESVRITIQNDAPTMRIDSPAPGSAFVEEQMIHFRSVSFDLNNPPSFQLTDEQVQWRSSRDGLLGRGHDTTAALSRGNHTITVTGSDGQDSGSASITLTINERVSTPPRAWIDTPVADVEYLYDGYDRATGLWYKDVELTALASDAEDGRLTGDSLVWRTNLPHLAPSLENGVWTGERVAVRLFSDDPFGVIHEITLVATDSDGLESSPILRRVRIWGLA